MEFQRIPINVSVNDFFRDHCLWCALDPIFIYFMFRYKYIYIYLSVYIHISTTCLYIYIVCTYIYINIHTYVCVYDGTAAAALIWMNGNHTQGKDHVFNPASV